MTVFRYRLDNASTLIPVRGGGIALSFLPTFEDGFVLGVTKPNATNTGVGVGGRPAYSELTVWNGDLTVASSNQTFRNLRITGKVKINSGISNTLLENCAVEMDAVYTGTEMGIKNDGINTVVRFCEIYGKRSWAGADAVGIRSMTVERCNMHHVADGIRIQYSTVIAKGNYIHDLLLVTPDPVQARTDNKNHCDGIQFEGGDGHQIIGNNIESFHTTDGTSNVVNVLKASPFTPQTPPAGEFHPQALSCLMFTPNVNAITNVLVDRNWMSGGEISCNVGSSGNSTSTINFTDNRFGHDQWYPEHTIDCDPTATNVIGSGNVYEDTGLPINFRRNA
jgi:hypothetical protein